MKPAQQEKLNQKNGGDKKGNLNERTQTNTTRGDHIGSCVSMVTKEADQGWNLVLQQACISCPHPPEVNEWEPQFDLKCEQEWILSVFPGKQKLSQS